MAGGGFNDGCTIFLHDCKGEGEGEEEGTIYPGGKLGLWFLCWLVD